MRYGNYDHMDNGWGIVMLLTMIALWALVAFVVVLLVKGKNDRVAPGAPRSSAEQILAERLARGDIDPAEYRERLEALLGRPGP